MQNSAIAVAGRGLDLNDSFGNLGPFTTDATAILRDPQRAEPLAAGPGPRHRHGLRGALGPRPGARRRDRQLEHDLRGARLARRGAGRDDPDLPDLQRGVAPDAQPARRVRRRHRAAGRQPEAGRRRPDADLRRRCSASRPTCGACSSTSARCSTSRATGLPALRRTLGELRPCWRRSTRSSPTSTRSSATSTTTSNNVSDYLINPPPGLAGTLAPQPGQPSPRHTLRQISYLSHREPLDPPGAPRDQPRQRLPGTARHQQPRLGEGRHLPQLRLRTRRGEIGRKEATPSKAACFVASDFPARFGGGRAPNIYADP